jgi:hypothetical protein
MARKPKYKRAVIDAETDPFKFGRVPVPFAWEFLSDDITETFWGDDCTEQLMRFLDTIEPHMIWAHNGGKFDFHFLHAEIENPIKIINSRIVSATLGQHVLRDSLAIIPVPLKRFFKGSKGDIDYRLMEREYREDHKTEILDYLHQDCLSLLKVVNAFVDRFGAKLTVGSTAMQQLIERHDFVKMRPEQDAAFRHFYFGGRVECFSHGIIAGPLKMYDVNSEYPAAMRNSKHPTSAGFHETDEMPDDFDTPFFIEFDGTNRGALPAKDDQGNLTFNISEGHFAVCSHELEVALEYGLCTIDRIHRVLIPQTCGTFGKFVDDFYAEKVGAKMAGDEVTEMFSKFMLNSAYGKFGSNPENFEDWYINRDFGNDLALRANGYELKVEYEEFELWSRPASNADNSYFNVATAASITSAARAILLRGIQHAVDPIYCDTDSLLCRDFSGEVSDKILGAWKLEKEAPMAAVAGKKLYALYDPKTLALPKTVWNPKFKCRDPNPDRRALKLSSKGGSLSVDEIIKLAKGGTVQFKNDAPTFSLHKNPRFITRNFVATVDDDELAI